MLEVCVGGFELVLSTELACRVSWSTTGVWSSRERAMSRWGSVAESVTAEVKFCSMAM